MSIGILSEGKKKLSVKVKNVAKVIEESKADIAKFDWEGAEISLMNLPKETLRRINFYIIETHTPEIRKAIIDKFKSARFKMARDPQNLSSIVSVLYFEKIP